MQNTFVNVSCAFGFTHPKHSDLVAPCKTRFSCILQTGFAQRAIRSSILLKPCYGADKYLSHSVFSRFTGIFGTCMYVFMRNFLSYIMSESNALIDTRLGFQFCSVSVSVAVWISIEHCMKQGLCVCVCVCVCACVRACVRARARVRVCVCVFFHIADQLQHPVNYCRL